jgi:hypothetical protein
MALDSKFEELLSKTVNFKLSKEASMAVSNMSPKPDIKFNLSPSDKLMYSAGGFMDIYHFAAYKHLLEHLEYLLCANYIEDKIIVSVNYKGEAIFYKKYDRIDSLFNFKGNSESMREMCDDICLELTYKICPKESVSFLQTPLLQIENT